MSNIDLVAVTRMVLILAHVLAFAAAFAGVAFGDFAIFSGRRVNTKLLARAAQAVSIALAALWISGLAVIWLDTRFDLAVLMAAPKLLAKLTVVTLLTINGIALHRYAFPSLSTSHVNPLHAATLPAILGAVSLTSWVFAAFLGVGKAVAPALGYSGFIGLYMAGMTIALTVALVHVRPRIAAQTGRMRGTTAKSLMPAATIDDEDEMAIVG